MNEGPGAVRERGVWPGVFCLHSFLALTPLAPLEPVVASHVPYKMEACKKCRDILLWRMNVELAGLEMREMELAHTIAKLSKRQPQVKFSEAPVDPNQKRARHSHMDEQRAVSRSSSTLMSQRRAEHCRVDQE